MGEQPNHVADRGKNPFSSTLRTNFEALATHTPRPSPNLQHHHR